MPFLVPMMLLRQIATSTDAAAVSSADDVIIAANVAPSVAAASTVAAADAAATIVLAIVLAICRTCRYKLNKFAIRIMILENYDSRSNLEIMSY